MMQHNQVEILLVEDNPDDVRLALHALNKNHLANWVEVVRDGEAALDFLLGQGAYANRNANVHPKVVLLDLKLPKVDGLEVLRYMKNNPKLKSIPVVILTSSDQENDIIQSYQMGVNSYIRKPVDFEQFVEAIRTLGYYWLILNEPPTA
jgi:two-component system, response regulator